MILSDRIADTSSAHSRRTSRCTVERVCWRAKVVRRSSQHVLTHKLRSVVRCLFFDDSSVSNAHHPIVPPKKNNVLFIAGKLFCWVAPWVKWSRWAMKEACVCWHKQLWKILFDPRMEGDVRPWTPHRSPRVLSPDSSCWILPSPLARAWSLTTCTRASTFIVRTSAPWTVLAWMKTISPKGFLPKPRPLSTNHLSTRKTTFGASVGALARLASHSSSGWEFSFSSFTSLLAATSVSTSSFLSRRTKNSTDGPISFSTSAHSLVPRGLGGVKHMLPVFGATWTNLSSGWRTETSLLMSPARDSVFTDIFFFPGVEVRVFLWSQVCGFLHCLRWSTICASTVFSPCWTCGTSTVFCTLGINGTAIMVTSTVHELCKWSLHGVQHLQNQRYLGPHARPRFSSTVCRWPRFCADKAQKMRDTGPIHNLLDDPLRDPLVWYFSAPPQRPLPRPEEAGCPRSVQPFAVVHALVGWTASPRRLLPSPDTVPSCVWIMGKSTTFLDKGNGGNLNDLRPNALLNAVPRALFWPPPQVPHPHVTTLAAGSTTGTSSTRSRKLRSVELQQFSWAVAMVGTFLLQARSAT